MSNGNIRPRYVNPPQFTTPPFVDNVDPYAGLDQILNNLNNVPQEQPQSKIQQILMAIANAAAVGTSNDPGAALGQLLQQQRQDQLLKQQRQQQQQDQLSNLKLQIGMRKADQLAEDQRQFKREQKERAYKLEDRQFQVEQKREDAQRRLDEMALQREWDAEDVQKKWNAELDFKEKNADRINEIERKRNEIAKVDVRLANIMEQTEKYRMQGMDEESARRIAIAELSGRKLTPEEQKELDKASKYARTMVAEKHKAEVGRLRQLATGGRGRGGSSGRGEAAGIDRFDRISRETRERAMANTADDDYVVVLDASGKERITGLKSLDLIERQRIKRYLTPEENQLEVSKRIGAMREAYKKELAAERTARGDVPKPDPTALESKRAEVNQIVRQMELEGLSATQINDELDLAIKQDPTYAQIYNGFKKRPAAVQQQKPQIQYKSRRDILGEPVTMEQLQKQYETTQELKKSKIKLSEAGKIDMKKLEEASKAQRK